jgi:4-hydroxy-2-oxoheptanedioate aldolase
MTIIKENELYTQKTMASVLAALNQMVDELYTSHGLVMFKSGSEWENMDLEEIAYLKQLGSYDIPMLMKVAGVEARTEMRDLLNIGVEVFLAPMVESEFALQKFVTITKEICQENNRKARLAMMIESIQTYNNLESILNSPYFNELEMVVLGRWDLANSMGTQNVDDPEVQEICKKIIDAVQSKGKSISVGGFVNPRTALSVKNELQADKLNTINFVLDINKCVDLSQAVKLMLQAEIAYYESLKPLDPQRVYFYQSRVEITKKKLGSLVD